MIAPEWVWIASRAGIDTTLMLLWGCFGLLSVAAPPPLHSAIERHLAGPCWWCIAILIGAVSVILPAEVANISDGWHGVLDPHTVVSFLTLTTPGKEWLFLTGGSTLIALARYLAPHRSGRLAASAGLTLTGLALTGHAAMNVGSARVLHAAVDIVHVLSAGAWFGGLVGFVFIMRAARDVELRPHAVLALRRFSTMGHIAVELVLLSGTANTLLVVGHLPTDWRSPYQARLLLKIGLVAVMTLTAIVNRYVFVPLLQRKNGWAEAALQAGAVFELLLGAVVIGLVAAFGTEDPS